MAIDAVEFPLTAKRFAGSTMWNSDISEGLNGDEVRNANWQDSLRRFNIAYGIKTLAEQAIAENWHIVCLGPVIGFLLKDWKDYKATNTATALGSGATRQGVTTVTNAPTNTIFQMGHAYSNGTRAHTRKITRPQSGTVAFYTNPGQTLIGSGYTVDYTTGLVTFTSAQTNPPFWAGQFYVPVRFQDDEIRWDIIKQIVASGVGYGEMPEIILCEIRE